MIHRCDDCVTEPFLKSAVQEQGKTNYCSHCHTQKQRTFSIEMFADFLAPAIAKHFTRWPEADAKYEQLGLELIDVINAVASEDRELREAIATELVSQAVGKNELFEPGIKYRQRFHRRDDAINAWIRASSAIKHEQRYFNQHVLKLFERLFDGVEKLTAFGAAPNLFPEIHVARTIPRGTSLFRARKLSAKASSVEDYIKAPCSELGAPPPGVKSTGRMNAAGVRVFYGSFDPDTCFAELRPSIGERLVLGRFNTSRDIYILDFPALKTSTSYEPDLLDPQYFEKMATRMLLEELSTQIALPVLPDAEDDYVITQAMAEYLAHVRKPGFDGIIFESAQRSAGLNLVLFESKTDPSGFPVDWAGEPPEVLETRAVEYTKEAISYGTEDAPYALPPRKSSAEWHRFIWNVE